MIGEVQLVYVIKWDFYQYNGDYFEIKFSSAVYDLWMNYYFQLITCIC